MLLQGFVLGSEVRESVFYDQVTGQPKPGYAVKLTVLDSETDETYQCQVTDGFQTLDYLKDLKKQGATAEVMQQAAAQLQTELPPKMTPIALQVQRIKGKQGFLTLVCKLAGVAATA